MLRPVSSGKNRMKPIGDCQPKHGNNYRMISCRFGIQRVVVSTLRSLLAAAMRRLHLHLLTVVLHRLAANPLLGIHLHVGNHAGHRRRQIGHQQQDHDAELAKRTHPFYLRLRLASL